MTYVPGQSIKFKTHSGNIVDGIVYDSNEYAIVVISHIFGQYVIDHKDVVHSTYKHKEEVQEDSWDYYAAYNPNTVMGNSGHYSPNKNYGGYSYLSPDGDDDGC